MFLLMSQPGPTRVAPRHPLVVDLRFQRGGALRRGVSENVSATGMYVRTAHAPSAGEIITVTRVPFAREVAVEMVAEVRWGRGTPTLDFPEPGFGVQFIELYAAEADRDGLISLLNTLGVMQPAARVRSETRGDVTLAVYRVS